MNHATTIPLDRISAHRAVHALSTLHPEPAGLTAVYDESAPEPWAVWDGDEEILGSGATLGEALRSAVDQVRAWQPPTRRPLVFVIAAPRPPRACAVYWFPRHPRDAA